MLAYATHKFASNVVETAVKHGDAKERRNLIEKMLERSGDNKRTSIVVALSQDGFGNYPLQKAIEVAPPDLREKIVQLIKENASSLKRLTYGKHILKAISSNNGNSHGGHGGHGHGHEHRHGHGHGHKNQ